MTEQRTTRAFDAVILAGGRASRLDGVDKPLLLLDGRTLLERVLATAEGAARTIVVGPPVPPALLGRAVAVREDPPFGGPVAALAAALPLLEHEPAPEWVLLLAGDLVDPAPAVETLLSTRTDGGAASLLAVDRDGRTQFLLGLHRTRELARALRLLDRVENASVRALLRPLPTLLVEVPAGSTDDVDDPADARAHGIALPGAAHPGAESTHD
ncbi:NTP transferase domain-containing protein [Rathayibacter sp. VKM Ac-2803]|uniref:molybdenum cofactor guanylyltransferase n=1 Tax=Rathayibacter sp. VKM Ac-2803 TaxID=2609256 RepID=UPI0013594B04|nr:NTP transferase domain-containing protein [Rathayibacter sp. VKM Ac-2803]MWV49213.1 NTP transferase domain-containing protein [Rathayibacter sp. VKM Ac-2803]